MTGKIPTKDLSLRSEETLTVQFGFSSRRTESHDDSLLFSNTKEWFHVPLRKPFCQSTGATLTTNTMCKGRDIKVFSLIHRFKG